MIDTYIKAKDEATAISALQSLGLYSISINPQYQSGWISSGPGWSLCDIGPITTTPGTYSIDSNGEMTTITHPIIDESFHLNIRFTYDDHPLKSLIEATGLMISVKSPRVVWFD
jgi:hypothetical protein